MHACGVASLASLQVTALPARTPRWPAVRHAPGVRATACMRQVWAGMAEVRGVVVQGAWTSKRAKACGSVRKHPEAGGRGLPDRAGCVGVLEMAWVTEPGSGRERKGDVPHVAAA